MGNRYTSVLHAQLRNNCSSLNNGLFRNHVRDNPLWDLFGVIEDAIHYLFHCINILMKDRFSMMHLEFYNLLPSIRFFLEAKTEILKQIWSC